MSSKILSIDSIIAVINTCQPHPASIPDEDKKAAYEKGYNDCLADLLGMFKCLSQSGN